MSIELILAGLPEPGSHKDPWLMIGIFSPVFAIGCLAGGFSALMRHVSQDPSRALKDWKSCREARFMVYLGGGFLILALTGQYLSLRNGLL